MTDISKTLTVKLMLIFFGILFLFILEELIRGYLEAQDKKAYSIKSAVFLFIVILLLFLFGPLLALSPIKIGFNTKKENHLELFYPAGRIDLENDIFKMAKEASTANEKFYGTSFYTPIIVGTSSLDMLRLGSNPNAGGTGNELTINVRADKASFNVIAHEMSHRYLAMFTGKSGISFPRWFDEGLASYLGKMDYYTKPNEFQGAIKDGNYKDNFIDMKGLPGILEWQWMALRGNSLRRLYGQSYLMVKYLFDTYGQDKVYQFVSQLKTQDFDQAFQTVFGKSEEQFNKEFLDYISSQKIT